MAKKPKRAPRDNRERSFLHHVREKEQRMLRSRRKGPQDIWFFLGFFGLVGWSVAVPVVLGIFLGIWIDGLTGSSGIWTLICLFAGLIMGLLNAWFWISRQGNAIKEERDQ